MHEVYKNDSISEDTFTDLAGNTDMSLPDAGELRLGDETYLDEIPYDMDGTQTTMPAEDEVLSVTLVCDICGIPVEEKKDLTKQRGLMVCKECIDEE